ncbi:hypothetical protein [Lentibacillus salinarum]|uniref:Helix-turn-helix domain-containing protein n=1 Tax=Lentibacillus salinarum TaxID=446820 RepID=A0ABW3ZXW3_9BACI
MRVYNVDSAFALLKKYKITTNKESVRRWLRQGKIKGIPPVSRKEGWQIIEADLVSFVKERIPEFNTTNFVTEAISEDDIRAKMWWEIVKKNIFEDFLEIKKSRVRECVKHKGYSKEFEIYVWENLKKNKRGYKTPRIPYLLDAFLFDTKRLLMDQSYENIEDKILFSLIEYLREKKVKK